MANRPHPPHPEGTRADLILVDGDPLDDVSVLRDIALVVQRGTVVFAR